VEKNTAIPFSFFFQGFYSERQQQQQQQQQKPQKQNMTLHELFTSVMDRSTASVTDR